MASQSNKMLISLKVSTKKNVLESRAFSKFTKPTKNNVLKSQAFIKFKQPTNIHNKICNCGLAYFVSIDSLSNQQPATMG